MSNFQYFCGVNSAFIIFFGKKGQVFYFIYPLGGPPVGFLPLYQAVIVTFHKEERPQGNTESERKRAMEGIGHKMVNANGISMHVAEKGEGPVVLFLHGFPELWYTWRHQILALSSLGYHAVAPDLRGYGDTEAPTAITSYSCMHIVGDLVALIDSLGVEQVFLIAHDWGAIIGWYLCLFRPDRVKAFVCLSVPFMPRKPQMKPVESMRLFFGDDYYICRFQVFYFLHYIKQNPIVFTHTWLHYGTLL